MAATAVALPVDTTRKFARWITGLRFDDIPSGVVEAAKRQVLDTVAVAWAGSSADGVDDVRQVIRASAGRPESRVWCFGDRLPATQAAFVNAMFASALDFDTLHDGANVHSDGVLLPALLALADSRGASGKQLITALVAGGELTVRLGLAAGVSPGWFYSSVFGVFGAAAASAKLLGLDESRTLHALGIALSQAAGTRQPLFERSLTKRLQAAYAARSGVESALLAAAGVTGPGQPLEGISGIHSLYAQLDPSITEGLGQRYESDAMTFKKFASCMCNHTPIEACLQLLSRTDLCGSDIESITVTVSPYMNRLAGDEFLPGENPQVSAQFNVRYSVASALLRKRFDVADIQARAVLDPKVNALVARVRVEVDEAGGSFGPAHIRVVSTAGAIHCHSVDAPPGSPSCPLSDADLVSKALACFGSASQPMPPDRARALIKAIQLLEHCSNTSTLPV